MREKERKEKVIILFLAERFVTLVYYMRREED